MDVLWNIKLIGKSALSCILFIMVASLYDSTNAQVVNGIRLVGGLSNDEGRVEILVDGQWGTVCDDLWDIDDATVVCRQLGFLSAIAHYTRAHFGEGADPTVLDNVECTGNEASLLECTHHGIDRENCDHDEDASVACQSGPSFSFAREIYSIDEATGSLNVTVIRESSDLSTNSTLSLEAIPLSAVDADYSVPPNVTIAANMDRATFTITIENSDAVENTECFEVAFTGHVGVVLGNYPITTTIFIKDLQSTIEFAEERYFVREGEMLQIGLIRFGSVLPTTVTHAVVTLAVTTDLTLESGGMVSFADESVYDMKMNLVMATVDNEFEDIECFTIQLDDATDAADSIGHQGTAEICVIDTSSIFEFQKSVYHVSESAGSVRIAVQRRGAHVSDFAGSIELSTFAGDKNIHLTAKDGLDFVGFQNEVINFDVNDRIQHHTIILSNGVDVAHQKYFEVCMSNPLFGIIDSPECAIIYIEDDDSVYGFDQPVYYVKEDSMVSVNVVRLGCLQVEGSVEIATSDVTAFKNLDYKPISNRLLPLRVGQSNRTVNVLTAFPDLRVEGQERFQICLSNPTQGVLGLYGLIRCTTIIIEDCDSEVLFGRTTYSVSEGTGVISVSVIRRGYLGNIVSVDVVSSNGNAKAGVKKDYPAVSRTIVFGASDAPEDTQRSIEIQVNDDDIVEHMETFCLTLQNVVGALTAFPKVAEVFIEDNDVVYRFDRAFYSVSEDEGEITLTVLRNGYLDQETRIGIYTEDNSAVSSGSKLDFRPILKVVNQFVVFGPDEISKTVTISIIDDTFLENAEDFEVKLNSDVHPRLGVPIVAVVTIRSNDNDCGLDCQNGGFCISPTQCQCASGYQGTVCDEVLSTSTRPRNIGGVFYAQNNKGSPFDSDLLNPTSGSFDDFAEKVKPQLSEVMIELEGFLDVMVLRVFQVFPFGNYISVDYVVKVAGTSPITAEDVKQMFVRKTGLKGYIGDVDWLLVPSVDNCQKDICVKSDVCKVLVDSTFICICDTGFTGDGCKEIAFTTSDNTDNGGLTVDGMIAIGIGTAMAAVLCLLISMCVYYMRATLPKPNPKVDPLQPINRLPDYAIGRFSGFSPNF